MHPRGVHEHPAAGTSPLGMRAACTGTALGAALPTNETYLGLWGLVALRAQLVDEPADTQDRHAHCLRGMLRNLCVCR